MAVKAKPKLTNNTRAVKPPPICNARGCRKKASFYLYLEQYDIRQRLCSKHNQKAIEYWRSQGIELWSPYANKATTT